MSHNSITACEWPSTGAGSKHATPLSNIFEGFRSNHRTTTFHSQIRNIVVLWFCCC